MANPFTYLELHSTDAGKAKAFYTELFGWTAKDTPVPGLGVYTANTNASKVDYWQRRRIDQRVNLNRDGSAAIIRTVTIANAGDTVSTGHVTGSLGTANANLNTVTATPSSGSCTTNDTTQVQQMLVMMLTMVIAAPMMAIGGVLLALSQDAALAWVLIAVTVTPAILLTRPEEVAGWWRQA